MKHTETFNYFLNDVVNLNKTRASRAEGSIETISSFLKNNEVFGPKFRSTSPQGSFRQKTIIRPADPEIDFDVDILFEMDVVKEWSAKDYLEKLAGQFKKTERYKEKVDTRGKTRCVTIDYESDFHVDIVPCIEQDSRLVIMNKKTNDYEMTDGDGYAEWFEKKNEITGGKYLIEVTRLIKYLRDYNGDFEIKSVLLTTLIGNQVDEADYVDTYYPDLPTALKSIVNRVNNFLQANVLMPEICNPVLPDESFNRNWDQAKYTNFRERFQFYNDTINEAFAEEDQERSLELWQKVFGEDFQLRSEEEKAALRSEIEYQIDRFDHQRPVSDIAKSEFLTYEVKIQAEIHRKLGKFFLYRFQSGDQIKAGPAIKFRATTNVRKPYEVYWQVVNTGGHAASKNGLRGSFFKAKAFNQHQLNSNPLINWEFTEYTGKHWIECFIVKDGVCLARSRPFFVNIENPNVAWWRRN